MSQLDSEILEDTAEENMEAEIEDADRYALDIERILTKVKNLNNNSNRTFRQNLNPDAQEFEYNPSSKSSNPEQNRTSVMSNSNAYHKLPKLSLPHFDGNLLNWQHFWDAFQSTIHNNQTISDVQKFSYLKNQLQGIAAQCIAGLPLTSANYYQAITLLTERFGQHHKITNAYIQNIIDLPAPRSDTASLQGFYDRIECYIRGLESLGTYDSTFGTILTPIIYNKLPSDVRRNITRDSGNDDWDFDSIRRAIKKELCVQAAGLSHMETHNHDSEKCLPLLL